MIVRLSQKQLSPFFSKFKIVTEKLFYEFDDKHAKVDVRLYLCTALAFWDETGYLSSQAWLEGTCTVLEQHPLLVKRYENDYFWL